MCYGPTRKGRASTPLPPAPFPALMPPEPEHVSVYVTAADEASAEKLAAALLERRLIACANILPCKSVYRWEGEVHKDPEVVMFLKTRRALAERVVDAVNELHEYDVPCAVTFDLSAGNREYLEWVTGETSPNS